MNSVAKALSNDKFKLASKIYMWLVKIPEDYIKNYKRYFFFNFFYGRSMHFQ